MHEDEKLLHLPFDQRLYVLVVGIDIRRPVAYGPFHTLVDAEYAAMDYYGTAVTGASARDAFLITELRSDVPPEGAWK